MKRRASLGVVLFALAAVAAGCAAAPRVRLPGQGDVGLDELLARHPIAAEAPLLPVLLQKNETQSFHLVQIRTREMPHRHLEHDLAVTVLRGEGVLHVGERSLPMQPGDVAVVQRGEAHWFENRGDEVSAAFVVFTPPYDGKDNVPLAPARP